FLMLPSSQASVRVSGHPPSVRISLPQLPQELILLIYGYIPEPDLFGMCQVSSMSRQLALLALLARHGISESQMQSQELRNISSGALRVLSASYPTVIRNIRSLNLCMTPGERGNDRFNTWRALTHLAERFPVIQRFTLTLPALDTVEATRLWQVLPAAVAALMRDRTRPLVVIRGVYDCTAVRPRLPNILKRAWKGAPLIDEKKLTQKLQYLIAAATTPPQPRISSIYLRSFTESSAMLGSLLILNPSGLRCLNIEDRDVSRSEWTFLLPELHLPPLRSLFIRVDLNYHALSAFLDRHHQIEHLEFTGDWTDIHNRSSSPLSISALPRLKRLFASCRVVACLLLAHNDFSQLNHVSVGAGERTSNDPESFQTALRAVAARPSVTVLTIRLDNMDAPWKGWDVKQTQSRAETELRHVQELRLQPWTRTAVPRSLDDSFPAWLTLFPVLRHLFVAEELSLLLKMPLLSERLVAAIGAACPLVIVKQERYIP
ncbi:hypothetical protein GGX14DRAFT_432037, partial [Mycena pura]